jgi:hypothetical protein
MKRKKKSNRTSKWKSRRNWKINRKRVRERDRERETKYNRKRERERKIKG